ncbi:triose-phosphate isomerase [Maridesulfovibrio hydrothermalis]|uniref:Triosephosphate isomerase n=1 Tax=Maridesulfovibrio hydrothermalis AM13 = DSM 14728 TaxID=1121451 RepID=L0RCS0_9BACT|nr:triose-phosphate isomerase [Maridesulfovibrio hydrothermalis]CCO24583.1 triose phosphate isomerase [Maridesulfovibrio hydrothermalis AM13 = DSM 14728]
MKKLMAANWKMYKTRAEAKATAEDFINRIDGKLPADREVLIAAPYTALESVGSVLEGKPDSYLCAENLYPAEEGAFTGEISPAMLKDVGCSYSLAGHSERRHIMGETDQMVGDKVAFGLKNGLSMILCIGETIEQRKAGEVQKIIDQQLEAGLKNIPADFAPETVVVAYEPVWAIGTGEVAGEEEIVEAHGFVRKMLKNIFPEKANEIRILYGGSVKPANCAQIIALDNVDGVLVGGASLDGESFSQIALA